MNTKWPSEERINEEMEALQGEPRSRKIVIAMLTVPVDTPEAVRRFQRFLGGAHVKIDGWGYP